MAHRVYDRDGTWYADIRTPGSGRTRRVIGKHRTKSEAKEAARQLAVRIGAAPVDASRSLSECFVVWLRFQDRAATDKSVIRAVLAGYPDRPAEKVTNESFRDAFRELSPGNYNRYVSVVNAAMRMGCEEHRVPFGKLRKIPVTRLPRRALTPEEWLRLKAELPEHLIGPAELAIATGLRRANVFGLRWAQIDMTARTITIAGSEMKASKQLVIPLGKWAREVIRKQIGQHETHVFAFRGRPIHSPKTAFMAALSRAQIENFNWHGFRHTFTVWLRLRGVPDGALTALGGWSSGQMLDVYGQMRASDLAKWVEDLPDPTQKRHRKGTKQAIK